MSPIREIEASKITETVKRLSMEANYFLGEDVEGAIKNAASTEESPLGKDILGQILENVEIARCENMPMCQDTGTAVILLELGQEVHVTGGDLVEAINEGVRQGYKEGYLRKSMCHPFTRKNTTDNTPAIIYTDIVPGDSIHITLMPKGGGAENMSGIKMLKPADGIKGVKDFVVDMVSKAGSNPCPPIIVGVGIGGTFERTALLAKRALLRPVGEHNKDPELAQLEKELLESINDLGIGPQGLGGRTTALWVAVEMMPSHIASFPVAVNINCHAARHKEATL